jgi:transcriptional regulator with XRE-family HTH domain
MDMQKVLHSESIRAALAAKGWDQKKLAEAVGVSAQAVTNWMKGQDFPRPATLLKLASTLSLGFDKLVLVDVASQPVIAFRKKGGAKTTEEHVLRARAMGSMLKPLVGYLPARQALRTQISDVSLAYDHLQATVAAVRSKLGIGQAAVLSYEHLIKQFVENDAVIVPVMWGEKKRHENALHILLPAEKVTFIYLNLDTHLEDFKFWMAHELAHVYTPDLAGKDAGEDFADAFAGALLFPKELAHQAYVSASSKRTASSVISSLHTFAQEHLISLYSVFTEVNKYAVAMGLPPLKAGEKDVHAVRNSVRGELVSAILFKPLPPDPKTYIASAHGVFQSLFFTALQAMLRDRGTGAGYVQQVLSVALPDAQAVYDELIR